MIVKDKVDGPDDMPVNITRLRTALIEKKVGSILNPVPPEVSSAKRWQDIINLIHEIALNETRSKIPILYGIDSIHGASFTQDAVLYPQPISMAASFNVDNAKMYGEIVAREQRASGIPWNFR